MFNKISIHTKIIFLSFLSSFIILTVGIFIFYEMNKIIEVQKDLEKSQTINSRFKEIFGQMINMESGVRGYLLTGKDEDFKPFAASETQFDQYMKETIEMASKQKMKKVTDKLKSMQEIKDNWYQGPIFTLMMARKKFDKNLIKRPDFDKTIVENPATHFIVNFRDITNKGNLEQSQNINNLIKLSDEVAGKTKSGTILGLSLGLGFFLFLMIFTNKILNEYILDLNEKKKMLIDKERDITSILRSVKQGLFIIKPDMKIHSNYSPHLEIILEKDNLGEKDVMKTIFDHAKLGSDKEAQLISVLTSSLGQNYLNFEFNEMLLVREFEYQTAPGNEKILEADWTPVNNDDGVTEKILVTIRDVTKLKKLQEETEIQKKKMERISEIINNRIEDFNEFIQMAEAYLACNRDLIEENMNSKNDHYDVFNILYRNLHTIKGSARLFGLKDIAEAVHKTESIYNEARVLDNNSPWNPQLFMEEEQKISTILSEYKYINEIVLNRGMSNNDSCELLSKESSKKCVNSLKKITTTHLSKEEKDYLLDAISILENTEHNKIQDILTANVKSLDSLALKLGKGQPEVRFIGDSFEIKKDGHELVKNVFLHILSNSMDHGIEMKDERLSKGKKEHGCIIFKTAEKNGDLIINYSDDGKGLNLKAIKEKGIKTGIISSNVNLNPDDIAKLIFAPGFSTASVTTEISGRGVGMDAVKSYLEKEGGKIKINLLDKDKYKEENEYLPFEFEISLPNKFRV